MTFSLTPLIWAVLGLILIIAEMLHLSMVLLFFGIAAFVTAGVAWLGLHNNIAQIVLFALLGLSGMLLFRQKLLHTFRPTREVGGDRHTRITLSADVPAHGSAPVQYQGTTWTAVNESDHDLKKDTSVYIHGTEGVKLIIKETPP